MKIAKNIFFACLGIILLLGGITLVLREWASLVVVFKGLIGVVLACVGIFILFVISGKSSKQ